MANWNFFSQFCETCESMFLVISIFSEKKTSQKMRADAVWLARAGLGGVALSSAGLSLPRYHSRPPPAALYLVHTTQLPPAPQAGRRRPAPNASPATDAPRVAPGLLPPVAQAQGPLCCSPKVASPLSSQQPKLLEIPVAHRSVSATSITNLS